MSGCNTCCCGGCWEPPHDGSATTAAIIKVQQFCCKCVPKYLCAALTPVYPGTGTSSSTGTQFTNLDDAATVLLEKYCPPQQNSNTPIQYSGNLLVNGSDRQVIVRFGINENNECYLEWEIASLDLSGSRLIDHTETGTGTHCQKTKACFDFGGEWYVDDQTIFSLKVPNTLDISKHINCSSCKCMCSCLCVSVASKSANGAITIEGSNQIVCSEIQELTFTNCSESQTEIVKSAVWQYDGWVFELSGTDDWPFNNYALLTGTEQEKLCEDITKLLRFNDSEFHHLTSDNGVVEIVYEASVPIENKPISFKWFGQVANENSNYSFFVFNWDTNTWTHIRSFAGRPDNPAVNKYFRHILVNGQSGVVNDKNTVRVRIIAQNALSLKTDSFRLKTTKCCEIKVHPKPGILLPGQNNGTGSSTGSFENGEISFLSSNNLAPVPLVTPTTCPSIFKFWNFVDTNDTEWYVTIDCSWCSGKCGTVATSCCSKPTPRVLIAEVSISCPNCQSPFSVLLNSSTGAIWEGTGLHCNQQFNVTFSCSGSSWAISVSGSGACSYSGSAEAVSCDPMYVVFNGYFGGGIGCCGVGSMDTSVPISITVFE